MTGRPSAPQTAESAASVSLAERTTQTSPSLLCFLCNLCHNFPHLCGFGPWTLGFGLLFLGNRAHREHVNHTKSELGNKAELHQIHNIHYLQEFQQTRFCQNFKISHFSQMNTHLITGKRPFSVRSASCSRLSPLAPRLRQRRLPCAAVRGQPSSRGMAWKRKVRGSILGILGFLLSPLSWWNDAFINLPLAVGFGWLVARFHQPAFTPAVVVGYWLTNVLGLILLHKGAQDVVSDKAQLYTRKHLLKDVAVSVAYTVLIVLLVAFGVLRPIQNYFPEK